MGERGEERTSLGNSSVGHLRRGHNKSGTSQNRNNVIEKEKKTNKQTHTHTTELPPLHFPVVHRQTTTQDVLPRNQHTESAMSITKVPSQIREIKHSD